MKSVRTFRGAGGATPVSRFGDRRFQFFSVARRRFVVGPNYPMSPEYCLSIQVNPSSRRAHISSCPLHQLTIRNDTSRPCRPMPSIETYRKQAKQFVRWHRERN
jgi:hypothetical protein